MDNTTINLKDDLHLTLNAIPNKAKKFLAGYLPFFSETETAFYVNQVNGKFYNYKNGSLLGSAKQSLQSAIEMLAGKNVDVTKVQFHIYKQS